MWYEYIYRRNNSIMKRSLAAVLAVVLAATMAFAGVQDFGEFKVDVPEGWTATKDGSTVAFVKDDNTSSMSITVDEADGASRKEITDAFVTEFKKTFKDVTAPQVDEDGDYMFEMTNEAGVKSTVLVTGNDKQYCLVVITGLEAGGEGLAQILATAQHSVTGK